MIAGGKDLRDGLVTIEAAARDYGVVAAGDPPVIDVAATEALRARLRSERKPLPAVAWEPRGMTLRIGIDIGGTFTDLVAIAATGASRTHKTASTPHDYGEGIIEGAALAARGSDGRGQRGAARHDGRHRTPCWRRRVRAPR